MVMCSSALALFCRDRVISVRLNVGQINTEFRVGARLS
uniref:Uncharacterized protein n=1 Tax=Anguilla anguilla TaxID=7936 RepID=A0A0E9W407_ANGAN